MSMTTAGVQTGSVAAALSSTGTGALASKRVTSAAHDFEAMMMKELLKPMTASASDEDQGDGDDLGSGSALGEYASEALGRALSQQGGFGIANKIIGSFSHSGNLPVTDTVTKLGTSNTVIGSNK
jgi:Rod binding domain-containing protein